MKLYVNLIKDKNKMFSSIKKEFDEHPIIKFVSIIVLIIVYFLFVSKSHGIKDGFVISILSWSFFVLCTPIADAGILIDFPMRLITGIKMIYSEMIVWTIAISINIFVLIILTYMIKQSYYLYSNILLIHLFLIGE